MIPVLHVDLVKKYIKWPNAQEGNALKGFYDHWPRVVAILDGTPFRISKPSGWYVTGKRYIFVSVSLTLNA